jgi:hypothetical protein
LRESISFHESLYDRSTAGAVVGAGTIRELVKEIAWE